MTTLIGVAEAASALGVTPQRIRQQLGDGHLVATRIGGRWVIDESSLRLLDAPRTPGRRLSRRSTWALIAVAALAEADDSQATNDLDPRWSAWFRGLAPMERARAGTRWSALRDAVVVAHEAVLAQHLRHTLGLRAPRLLLRAAEPDLPDLRTDVRVSLSGVSQRASGLASGGVVEGYVPGASVDDLVQEFFLRRPPSAGDWREANVVLHVIDDPLPAAPPVTSGLLLATDLAEHRSPREEARAAAVLHATPRGGRP